MSARFLIASVIFNGEGKSIDSVAHCENPQKQSAERRRAVSGDFRFLYRLSSTSNHELLSALFILLFSGIR